MSYCCVSETKNSKSRRGEGEAGSVPQKVCHRMLFTNLFSNAHKFCMQDNLLLCVCGASGYFNIYLAHCEHKFCAETA